MTITIGTKRICVGCAAKFYDLGKNPAKCPQCGTMNDSTITHRRRTRKAVAVEDGDDPLLAAKVQMELRQAKAKKPVKKIEGVDLDAFEDIEPIAGGDDIEELEEEDIDTLESLDVLDEDGDDIAEDELEENELGDEKLMDEIKLDEEEEEELEEDEEDEKPSRSKAKASAAKGKVTASKATAKKAAFKAPAKKPAKKR